MVVLWGIVVPNIAHASFCDTVDYCRQRSRARMRHNDRSVFTPFSTKATKASFLKTKKMSQWTKQMRWRIKKSLPSFVSYVDVERYAVSRLFKNKKCTRLNSS